MSSNGSLQSVAGIVEATSVVLPPYRGGQPQALEKSTIWAESEMQQPALFSLAAGKAAIFTHPSPAKSTPNEDVVSLIPVGPRQAVLIVADGVGGHASGEDAAKLAVSTIMRTLEKTEIHGDADELRPAILNGIEAANQAVCSMSNGSASTLAVAEVNDGVIRTYHVGDSAILLTGGRGRLKLQTIAHSPVGYAVVAGLMDEDEAIHHENRHVISNVIGDTDMRIEIGPPLKLAPRDTLVLASDGLLDNLLPQEIVELVRTGPVDCGVGRLANEALTRMTHPTEGHPSKPDDLGIIAFRLG